MEGYTYDGVCSNWVKKSNWAENQASLIDGVSGPTPKIGAVQMDFDWNKEEVPAGKYKYFIEVHLEDNFNEIYSGEIELGKKPNESIASVTYSPEKNIENADVLTNVKVHFQEASK